MSINQKFAPENLITNDTFKGEPMKRRIKTTKLHNGKQTIELATISKKNLSLGPYQRPEDSKRIDAISDNYHPDFGIINVAEIEYNGEYYYTIPDGQHRAKAQPEATCPCVITNSLPEAELFLLANNPKCTKSTTPDDRFWASLYNDDEDHVWFYNFMKDEYDIELNRSTKENFRDGKFTGGVSIFKSYNILLRDEFRFYTAKDRLKIHESDVKNIARGKFKILCDVVFGLFGQSAFYGNSKPGYSGTKTAYADLWSAMRRFLNSADYDWRDPSDAIESMSKGYYAKGGLGKTREELVRTVEEYHTVAKTDYPMSQRVDQLRCVISAIYKKGRN